MRHVTLLTALLLAGCIGGADALDAKQLEIDHFQVPCTGWEGHDLCLRSRAPGEETWTYFYETIHGFDFRWGERTSIAVREEPVEEVAEDAPPVRTVLEAVRARSEVEPGTEFFFAIDGEKAAMGYLPSLSVDGQSGQIRGGPPFACAAPEVCAAIVATFAARGMATARFAYADPIDAPLIALAVE